MRVAIHQPNFLPRLKVLQKIAAADVWVVLDSVQYCEREWQNRARIVALHGDSSTYWLSIPVHRPQGLNTLIKDVAIVDPIPTAQQVQRALSHSFRRAPYWQVIDPLLGVIDAALRNKATLTAVCVDSTCSLLTAAGLHPEIVYASSLPVSGKASVLMAAISRHVAADEYLADSGALAYLRPADFGGIKILWQQWEEPAEEWPGIDCWRNVSAINYLCREGPDHFAQHLADFHFAPEAAKAG